MRDWNTAADGVISTAFAPPNEITVLFDDGALTFPTPAAATLADVAGRLTKARGPQRRQMLSVTIKLAKGNGMTCRLADKVAVVTGGSAGIGLGIAKQFSEEGARVFIIARRQSELEKAVATIGSNATAIQGDTTRLADLDRIFAVIEARAGRIDVLVANAGVYEPGPLGTITEEHFDKTFDTNVRGLLFTVQKALPLLGVGSSVILIGSMVSSMGFAGCSVYNASKAAVRSLPAPGSSTSAGAASGSTF